MGADRSGPSTALGVRTAAAVFLPFAAAYALSYLFRSVNAVIAPDLVHQFALTPSQLGLLTSAYFLSFAAFQLPLGLLLDRYGPRRTDAALVLIAACGALVFAAAPDAGALIAGRALIGLGVSGCLMSGLKANVLWFPLARLPAMNGWMFFAGGVGMVLATLPVELLVEAAGWRTLFFALALLAMLSALGVLRVVPEREEHALREPLSAQLAGLRSVFAARRFWYIGIAAVTSQATNMAVQGLWSGPWLRDVAGLGRQAAAAHLLIMAIATMAGFLLWGNAASWAARRGVPAARVFALGMGIFLLVQSLLVFGAPVSPALIWIGFGVFGTAGSLSYAVLSYEFPRHLAGRVTTALNAMVFSWAFVVQWAIGGIIELWPAVDGRYHASGYRAAFGVFLAVQVLAFGWMLLEGRRLRRAHAGS
jgi:MFS family permease